MSSPILGPAAAARDVHTCWVWAPTGVHATLSHALALTVHSAHWAPSPGPCWPRRLTRKNSFNVVLDPKPSRLLAARPPLSGSYPWLALSWWLPWRGSLTPTAEGLSPGVLRPCQAVR